MHNVSQLISRTSFSSRILRKALLPSVPVFAPFRRLGALFTYAMSFAHFSTNRLSVISPTNGRQRGAGVRRSIVLPDKFCNKDPVDSCTQRLKSALWFSIGKIVDEETLKLGVNTTPQFIGALTEMVWAQIGISELSVNPERYAWLRWCLIYRER